MSRVFYHSVIHSLIGNVVKNNSTHFFYVLYSDKTWVLDQSECTLGPIIKNSKFFYTHRHKFVGARGRCAKW